MAYSNILLKERLKIRLIIKCKWGFGKVIACNFGLMTLGMTIISRSRVQRRLLLRITVDLLGYKDQRRVLDLHRRPVNLHRPDNDRTRKISPASLFHAF